MSFAEKIGALMQRPGQDVVPKDDVPWWLKYAGRAVGTIGGVMAIIFGVIACASILLANISCLIAGIWQMIAGFSVLVIEAPCCCMFVDFVQSISDFMENRPYWNRGALYITISMPPIFLCFSASTFVGSGLIFATGIIYGMMALGKKASAEEMRSRATATAGGPPDVPNTGMKNPLVDNAQPIGFTGPPFDSNV